MRHLLVHCALFAPLPNGAFLQLSGVAVTTAAKALSPYAPAAAGAGGVAAAAAVPQQPQPQPQPQPAARAPRPPARSSAAARARRRRSMAASPDTQDGDAGGPEGDPSTTFDSGGGGRDSSTAAVLLMSQEALELARLEAEAAEDVPMHEAAPDGARATRPPSWQRRRDAASRAAAAAGVAPAMRAPQPAQPAQARRRRGVASDSPAASQPPTQQQAAPAGGGRGRHAARVGARLNDITLSHPSLFYNAAFPRRAGFPRGHVLHAAGSGTRGARRLLQAIFFDAKLLPSPMGGTPAATAAGFAGGGTQGVPLPLLPLLPLGGGGGGGGSGGARGVAPPVARPRHPRRVARAWRALLPPLAALLRRAARCPFRALLEAHCPLPPGMRAAAAAATRARRAAHTQPHPQPPASHTTTTTTSTAGRPAPSPAFATAPPPSECGYITQEEDADGDDGHISDGDDGDAEMAVDGDDAAGGAAAPAAPAAEGLAALLGAHTPPQRVAAFAWAVLRRVLPPALRGGRAGGRALRALLRRFAALRRHDALTLHAAAQALPTRAWPLLSLKSAKNANDGTAAKARTTPSAHAATQRRLAKLVRFIFGALLLPLLRSHFYVTEGEPHRGRVFFFRKPLWARLRAAAAPALRAVFAPLRAGRAAALLRSGRTLGVAPLRLLPKRAGLRPIANLGRASSVTLPPARRARAAAGAGASSSLGLGVAGRATRFTFRAVNADMAPAFAALRAETGARPHLLGAGVFDYAAVYARLAPFIRAWRTSGSDEDAPRGLRRPVYVVAVDISRAFDTVPQPALLALAEGLLRAPAYSVMRYACVTPAPAGRLHTRWMRVATPTASGGAMQQDGGDEHAPAALSAAVCAARPRAHAAVVVDSAAQQRVARPELLRRLREHLGQHLVKLGGAFLQQHVGIPQGSVLSSLLCSAFYADMERANALGEAPAPSRGRNALADADADAHRAGCSSMPAPPAPAPALAPASAPESVLVRWVDDFLFLSVRRDAAEAFVARAHAGFPAHGAAVSVAKTALNFDACAGGTRLPRNEYTSGGAAGSGNSGARYIRWCGLLIDSATLALRADYSRYEGVLLRDGVAVPSAAPGAAARTRLRAYLRPKAAALLFDSDVNGAAGVALNVHQAFLLAAAKLHVYVAAALRGGAPPAALLAAAVEDGIRYMERLLRSRLAAAAHAGAPPPPRALRAGGVRFLALAAFVRVLGRKQARHAELLRGLRAQLRGRSMRAVAARPALAAAVEPAQSPELAHLCY
jgi:telomerase reverse transcriptase